MQSEQVLFYDKLCQLACSHQLKYYQVGFNEWLNEQEKGAAIPASIDIFRELLATSLRVDLEENISKIKK